LLVVLSIKMQFIQLLLFDFDECDVSVVLYTLGITPGVVAQFIVYRVLTKLD
jgi:hypothetical protein